MRRMTTANADQLQYLDGGGCVIAIGVIFLSAGLLVLGLGFMDTPKLGSGPYAETLGLLLTTGLGLLFSLLGGAIAFGIGGLTFDRQARTARRWWGLRRFFSSKIDNEGAPANVRLFYRSRTHHFTDSTRVMLTRQVTKEPRSNQERINFNVSLEDRADFAIIQTTDELEARAWAEEIAGFLGLGLADDTSGTRAYREPGTVEQPLKLRVRRLQLPKTLPPLPENMRFQHRVAEGSLLFEAPREPFDPFRLLHLLGPLLFSGFAIYFLTRPMMQPAAGDRWLMAPLILIFVCLPTLLGAISFLHATYWGGVLEITAEQMRITTRGRLWQRTAAIPLADLDEVRINRKPKTNSYVKVGDFSVRTDAENAPAELEALSRSCMASFGRGLSDVELGWIREVVLKALAA